MHYGVKGMQWGVRRKDSGSSRSEGSLRSGGLSDKQKKALKYAAGGALTIGAVAGVAILAKNGKLPVSSLSIPTKRLTPSPHIQNATRSRPTHATRQRGSKTQREMGAESRSSKTEKGKALVEGLTASRDLAVMIKEFRAQLEADHQAQTQMMIKESSKAGLPYNAAKDNRFSPEARQKQKAR